MLFRSLISATPTAGTVGNISRANNTWWRNIQASASSAFSTNGINQLRSIMLQCTYGSDSPNLIAATRSGFENYMRVLQATLSYNLPGGPLTASEPLLDIGVKTLKFFGMDMIYDDFVPTDRMFLINTKYLHFMVSEERDFVLGEFVAPADKDTITAHIKRSEERRVGKECRL